MAMDPDEIPPSLYTALIAVFHDMDDENKELFIENSYQEGNYVPTVLDQYYTVGYTDFQLSPVFSSMALIMDEIVKKAELEKTAHYTPEVQKLSL